VFTISDAEMDRWFAEDVPYGDLTTHALGIGTQPASMEFRARQDMVVACSEEAARLIERAGGRVIGRIASGARLQAQGLILTAAGPAQALLAAWKVAQTLVEAASGIASSATTIVEAAQAEKPGIVVACTRKAFPGTRTIAAKAVLAGGASMHRLGLSETLLVFPQHRRFLAEPLEVTVARLKAACPEKKVVVEVCSVDEAMAAMAAGADVVQLEKFTPEQVARVSSLPGRTTKLAAAGGVNGGNAAAYARAGADVLVTSAPYWAPPRDVQVTISPR